MRLVSIGECMIEMSQDGEGRYRLGYAGDTLNTAWYARAHAPNGWRVEYVTAVGEDLYSNQMISFFEQHAIGTHYIRRIPDRRPGVYLIHQEGGDRHFTYWRELSAARCLVDDQSALVEAVTNADLVYFSGVTLAILTTSGRERFLEVIRDCRRSGKIVAFDPNERPKLWRSATEMAEAIQEAAACTQIVLPTFQDEQALFGDVDLEAVARRYLSWGATEVVVKDGGNAAYVCHGTDGTYVEATGGVEPIDATGAGDSFNGCYLAIRLMGSSPAAAARLAHATAAVVVTHRGALVDMELVASVAAHQPH